MVVESVERVFLAIGTSFGYRVWGDHGVELADELQVHLGGFPRPRGFADEVNRQLVVLHLFVHRDERHIADDPLVDGGLQL